MSYTETGLGWYADSDWLEDVVSVLATVEGGHGVEVPYSPDYIDIGHNIDSNYPNTYLHLSITSGTAPCFFYILANGPNGEPYSHYMVSDAQFFHNVNYYPTSSGGGAGSAYDSTLQKWFSGGHAGSWDYNALAAMWPVYATQADAVADIYGGGGDVEFKKSSSGYCVNAIVKWRESLDGDVYVSPVLISSENSNTFWTVNGNVPLQALTEHTFQGMNFFMRYSKLYEAEDYSGLESNVPVLDYSESAPITDDILFALIASASSLGVGFPPQDEDPYGSGGTSGPSQPNGDFDFDSEPIPDSPLPTYSFAASGFCRIYNPSLSQLSALAHYMWTDQTFLQTVINHLKQLLENPVDAVISLSMLPISIPNGSSQEVKIMYIPTGVYMPPATQQIVDVDCGSVFINEAYGSALDYNPYTKVSMFLPFIGMVDLDTDEVMNQTLFVKYRVDIVSGACTAKIIVGSQATEKTLYQFSGDCSISMPLNSADFSAYRAAFISAAKAVVTGIGAAGAGIDAAIEAVEAHAQTSGAASSVEAALAPVETSLVPFRDGPTVLHGGESANSPTVIDVGKFGDMLMGAANNTVGAVTSGKLTFQHASGFSGNSGMLGVRRPFVVIKRPDMANPEGYGSYNGRPCLMNLYLGSLSGFTQMQRIHLTGFSATNPELSEIGDFLKNGVIL